MTRQKFHHAAYVLCLMLLMASMPLSHFGMGLMAFLLLLNWVAEWNWKEKWERLMDNKFALVLSSILLALCLGLIRADDLPKALQQLASMLFLIFPIIMVTSKPLGNKERHLVFGSFVLATLAGCFCSVIYWRTHEVADMREISIFVDHIRFSLCIVMSVVFSIDFLLKGKTARAWQRLLTCLTVLLLLIYMFIAQTLTGIVVLFFIALAYGIYLTFYIKNDKHRNVFLYSILTGLLLFAGYVTWITYDYFHDKDGAIVERMTSLGNAYTFDENSLIENGRRIDYYVCETELDSAWALRSNTSLTALHKRTLIRYLNSKGLHKDFAAVMSLTDKDIRNIEMGIANCVYTNSFGLRRGLYPIYFSFSMYNSTRFVYDSSVLLRVEIWRMSWSVIRDNWFFGVGLGDNKSALKDQFIKCNSPALESHKQGCHNQFLTFWMCGGILVAACFLFVLFYPFLKMRDQISFIYVAFFILMFLSFFMEDTIDSQTGCLLYAILNPMLLHKNKHPEPLL